MELHDLEIRTDFKRRATERAFGAKSLVEEPVLVVPEKIARLLELFHLDTASAFLSYAKSFPWAFAESLGMSEAEAEAKVGELAEDLKRDTRIDVKLLQDPVPLDVAFGVRIDVDPRTSGTQGRHRGG